MKKVFIKKVFNKKVFNKKVFNKKVFNKSAAASVVLAGLTTGLAQADTFNATLNLVQPIALSEATQMDLGSINANDADTCTVAALGARSGAACFGSGSGTLAAIDVSGTTGMQVDITLTAGGSAASELSFVPSMIDNGVGGTVLTGVTLQVSHQLSLGGTVTVDNAALAISNSVASVDYQVDVTYQ